MTVVGVATEVVMWLILEFEFHLDLQADSSNNVCSKRMENEDTK